MPRFRGTFGIACLKFTKPLGPCQRLHHWQRRPQVGRPVTTTKVLHQPGQPLLVLIGHRESHSRAGHAAIVSELHLQVQSECYRQRSRREPGGRLGQALNGLGPVPHQTGEYPAAAQALEQALAIYRKKA
jgi:hypothetical protein